MAPARRPARSAARPGLPARATLLPAAPTGCDRPRVAPCPLWCIPGAPGEPGGSGTRRSGPRDLGGSTSPSPLGGGRGGGRAAAPSPAARFLERRAEIAPSPLGADLGTWAGPRTPPPHPGPPRPAAFRNPAPQNLSSETPPDPARGPPARAPRVEATPPVRSWRGEGEGTLGSAAGRSPPTPPPSEVLGEATTPPASAPHPAGLPGCPGAGSRALLPPRTLARCHPAAGRGASQLSSSGGPETRSPCGSLARGRRPPQGPQPAGPALAGCPARGPREAGDASRGCGGGGRDPPLRGRGGEASLPRKERLPRPPPEDPRVLSFSLSVSAVPRLSVLSSFPGWGGQPGL
nr:basic proline-rich protein-like [Meriones unguiculatus]